MKPKKGKVAESTPSTLTSAYVSAAKRKKRRNSNKDGRKKLWKEKYSTGAGEGNKTTKKVTFDLEKNSYHGPGECCDNGGKKA